MGYRVIENSVAPADVPVEVWGNRYTRIIEVSGGDVESLADAIAWVSAEILATPARLNEVMFDWKVSGDPPVAIITCIWTPTRTS